MNITPEQISQFNLEYLRALDLARTIVTDREATRNSVTSIPEMFLHGLQDITGIVYMKMGRLISEEACQDWVEVDKELIDIINYSAFGIAYIRTFLPQNKEANPLHAQRDPTPFTGHNSRC